MTHLLSLLTATLLSAPSFTLTRTNDSLYHLNKFPLPYPVYRFCTADVDGDGNTDALVGVIKKTRFHQERNRRIFIFKLVDGEPRPLWMGSKLGGILQDFRVVEPKEPQQGKKSAPCTVRSLETTADGRYVVAEYSWEGFGLSFQRFLVKNTDKKNAMDVFNK